MKQAFNDFLMVKCMESTHALDDELPDVFESWIGDQNIRELRKEWKGSDK